MLVLADGGGCMATGDSALLVLLGVSSNPVSTGDAAEVNGVRLSEDLEGGETSYGL